MHRIRAAARAARCYSSGDIPGALAAIEELAAADPADPSIARIRAGFLILTGHPGDALDALAPIEDTADTWLLRAKAHETLGPPIDARQNLDANIRATSRDRFTWLRAAPHGRSEEWIPCGFAPPG